jgi:hypothetical protein
VVKAANRRNGRLLGGLTCDCACCVHFAPTAVE